MFPGKNSEKTTYKLWRARLLHLWEENQEMRTLERQDIHFIMWAVWSCWLWWAEPGQGLGHSGPLSAGVTHSDSWLCYGGGKGNSGWEWTLRALLIWVLYPPLWVSNFSQDCMWASNTFNLFFPSTPKMLIILFVGEVWICWDWKTLLLH